MFYNQSCTLEMLLCRLKELGHMVAVTARRATGHLCRAPGSLTEEPCSKLWRQTVLSQALQMRGALPNTERAKGLQQPEGRAEPRA